MKKSTGFSILSLLLFGLGALAEWRSTEAKNKELEDEFDENHRIIDVEDLNGKEDETAK